MKVIISDGIGYQVEAGSNHTWQGDVNRKQETWKSACSCGQVLNQEPQHYEAALWAWDVANSAPNRPNVAECGATDLFPLK